MLELWRSSQMTDHLLQVKIAMLRREQKGIEDFVEAIIAEVELKIAAEKTRVADLRTLCKDLAEFCDDIRWSLPIVAFQEAVTVWRHVKMTNIVVLVCQQLRERLDAGASFRDLYKYIHVRWDTSWNPRDGGPIYIWPDIDDCLWRIVRGWEMDEMGELQRFVEDEQNSHNSLITAQTKKMYDLLLAVPIPDDQETFVEIAAAFREFGPDHVKVLYEIYSLSSEILIINNIWAKIRASSDRELIIRLYEECQDAMGMCIQGWISRLINVFVGFDLNFEQPASLQDRMADISRLDVSIEEKHLMAQTVFQEMSVPPDQHEVWLSALTVAIPCHSSSTE